MSNPRARDVDKVIEHFKPAVVAPITRVDSIIGLFQLVRLDLFVIDADVLRAAACRGPLLPRNGGRESRHRDDFFPAVDLRRQRQLRALCLRA